MSMRLIVDVINTQVNDAVAKLVLIMLADRANNDNADEQWQCWPSVDRIGLDASLSRATVQRKLRYLEQHGFIRTIPRKHTSSMYIITIHEAPTPQIEAPPGNSEAPPRLSLRPKPVIGTSKEPVNLSDSDPQDSFGMFWTVYPRKIAKAAALKAWEKAVKLETGRNITAAANRFAQSQRGKDVKYIPHASTWLNQERWTDDPEETDESGWGDLKL